uniref:U-box domain-containing protein n=1 Tax=Davidia involucrata TaxID=16924 RepID=A0A5B7BYP4_DAVIN
MDEIDVPSHFVCPISMQLMRDPVTLSTGITYDRNNIERWLYSCNNNTCPVTKQALLLSDTDLTPNHTLRRLIQAWCTLNSSHGIERIPTPKPPVDKSQIVKLVHDANKSPHTQLKCLKRLRSIANGGERNKKCLEDAGALEFLASLIKKDQDEVAMDNGAELMKTSDEALNILYHLHPSETGLKRINIANNGEFVESLMHALRGGNYYQSRAYAMTLLKSIFEVADPVQLIGVKPEFFIEVVHILRDSVSQQVSKAALKLLAELCPWGRNRIKAVQGGAVWVLIELLLETKERRACELVLVVLDQLCRCAEGRAELLRHGGGLAIVSKKILRVSHVASDRAVRVLSSISRFSATSSRVLQEMLQVGVVSKLCLVIQVDSSVKTKERAKEILKLHSRVWKNSSCVPPHLLSSYPSS